jgi:hypothetical protein
MRRRLTDLGDCHCRNFDCPTMINDYVGCKSSLNSLRTASYTDRDGNSSVATFYAVTASPIQIRFKASDSDVVPIPTDSFDLPPPPTKEELEEEQRERERQAAKGQLSTGAKAGIAVGAVAGVVALIVGACCFCKVRKAKQERRANAESSFVMLQEQAAAERVDDADEAPPPYTKK